MGQITADGLNLQVKKEARVYSKEERNGGGIASRRVWKRFGCKIWVGNSNRH